MTDADIVILGNCREKLCLRLCKMIVDLLIYIYLTPVKTQLLQYNLTRDLMLFYHSNKIKA